eukprot:TRINITY_DN6474_c0_g1_i3.p1 TRINITY_DN6474_c0_g1~~TRINITY_DN6474_c0_g1_i3.p1  ORF type:complete len:270 (+),score=59.67 TRINITY_DN6474_c0_g1_i3:104-811(+)
MDTTTDVWALLRQLLTLALGAVCAWLVMRDVWRGRTEPKRAEGAAAAPEPAASEAAPASPQRSAETPAEAGGAAGEDESPAATAPAEEVPATPEDKGISDEADLDKLLDGTYTDLAHEHLLNGALDEIDAEDNTIDQAWDRVMDKGSRQLSQGSTFSEFAHEHLLNGALDEIDAEDNTIDQAWDRVMDKGSRQLSQGSTFSEFAQRSFERLAEVRRDHERRMQAQREREKAQKQK